MFQICSPYFRHGFAQWLDLVPGSPHRDELGGAYRHQLFTRRLLTFALSD